MAEIRPLRAWRYHPSLQSRLDSLVSPLFDVVSEKQRQHLYTDPNNSIHISVPSENDAPLGSSRRLINWKKNNIIVQDRLPSIYVYYQYYSLPGSPKEIIRKGFIANFKIADWDDNIILRHENTMPFSVKDRMDVLAKTQMNVSPTHGLFTDDTLKIEKYLDAAIQHPLYQTEDYQGVRDVFAVIHDAKVIQDIISIMKDKQIILADGHHRYEGSLLYKKEEQNKNPQHTGDEGYNYHMMYFTNTESDNLRILPTHRLISGLGGFESQEFMHHLSRYFTIDRLDESSNLNEVILGKKWTYGILIDGTAYKIKLKPERINEIDWKFPKQIKELDLTVMHYFIIEKCLGILGKNQRNSTHIHFERNYAKCLEAVTSNMSQLAIITHEISIDTVKDVCYSGHTLPQKSTYFYPKVICGFLFGSIRESEFKSTFDAAFK